MASKRTWNDRIQRLRYTLERLDNTSDLTSGQKYLRKQLKEFLGSEGDKTAAAINQLGSFADLDKLEKAVRQALKGRPIVGLNSRWNDEEEEPGSEPEQEGDNAEQQEPDDSDNQQSEDDRPEERKRKDSDKQKEQEPNRKESKQEPERAKRTKQQPKTKEPARSKQPKTPKPTGAPKVAPTAGAGAGAGGAGAAAGAAGGGAAAGGAAAGGTAAAAGGTAAVAGGGWIVIVVVLVLLIIVGIVMYVTYAGKNKVFSSAGGSLPLEAEYDNPEHRAAAEKVASLIHPPSGEPVVVIREPAKEDDLIGWRDQGNGKLVSRSDLRILQTIGYLADQGWTKIVIGLTSSGGPDMTLRQGSNTRGQSVQVDALSAYDTGQAIGIVALGETSPGLTACLNLNAPIPVEISWQETAIETRLRPLHEKLQVSASQTYSALRLSAVPPAIEDSLAKPLFRMPEGTESAGKVQDELTQMVAALRSNSSTNPAALRYAEEALADVQAARSEGTQVAREQMRRGLAKTFRMLQTANTRGWEGSREANCRLWKAYEARVNERKLGLQIMRMPFAIPNEQGRFNEDLVAKQLIFFSPEDDLDNGLPDSDVYPLGAVAVDVGGVSFDDSEKDGVITKEDNHFLALPQDNGILSKASTIFASRTMGGDLTEGAGGVAVSSEDRQTFDSKWDFGRESGGRVSYKNFVHIGF